MSATFKTFDFKTFFNKIFVLKCYYFYFLKHFNLVYTKECIEFTLVFFPIKKTL